MKKFSLKKKLNFAMLLSDLEELLFTINSGKTIALVNELKIRKSTLDTYIIHTL